MLSPGIGEAAIVKMVTIIAVMSLLFPTVVTTVDAAAVVLATFCCGNCHRSTYRGSLQNEAQLIDVSRCLCPFFKNQRPFIPRPTRIRIIIMQQTNAREVGFSEQIRVRMDSGKSSPQFLRLVGNSFAE